MEIWSNLSDLIKHVDPFLSHCNSGFFGNALQAACYKRNVKIAKLLLENGANVNAKCEEYGNALYAACVVGNVDMVKLLLVF